MSIQGDLAALLTRVQALEAEVKVGSEASLSTQVATVTAAQTALTTQVSTVAGQVATIQTDIGQSTDAPDANFAAPSAAPTPAAS